MFLTDLLGNVINMPLVTLLPPDVLLPVFRVWHVKWGTPFLTCRLPLIFADLLVTEPQQAFLSPAPCFRKTGSRPYCTPRPRCLCLWEAGMRVVCHELSTGHPLCPPCPSCSPWYISWICQALDYRREKVSYSLYQWGKGRTERSRNLPEESELLAEPGSPCRRLTAGPVLAAAAGTSQTCVEAELHVLARDPKGCVQRARQQRGHSIEWDARSLKG